MGIRCAMSLARARSGRRGDGAGRDSRQVENEAGLITDIHEQVELLAVALDRLQREQVAQTIMLGDVFETGERMAETCQLLVQHQVVGVWGNHDYGLCVDPEPELRHEYGDLVVDYMTSLKPRLEIAGCLFQHVEPWLNPEELTDLWYFEGLPDTPEKRGRIFGASEHRIMFAGHFHRWLLATADNVTAFTAQQPLCLIGPQRYFVVIGALSDGWFATFDTESCELVPFHLDTLAILRVVVGSLADRPPVSSSW